MPTQNTSAQIRICGPCPQPLLVPPRSLDRLPTLPPSPRGLQTLTKQRYLGTHVLPPKPPSHMKKHFDGLLYKSAEHMRT